MSGSGPFQDKPSLSVEDLSLVRGGRVLFEGMSFAAAPGAYVELRGANGSGKTSLLRALAGFLKPRTGRIVFTGLEEVATTTHFVGHANGLKPTESVRAHMTYWAGLLGGAYTDDVLQRLGLSGLGARAARTLSQGQARRLALSRLLIAPRPIWLLDEPVAALDDAGRAVVGELVKAHCGHGGVVIAAVHEALGPEPARTLTIA
jgi:heme exporter protein A